MAENVAVHGQSTTLTAAADSGKALIEPVKSTSNSLHVTEQGILGVGVADEIADQTTTPTQKDYSSGLVELNVAYVNRGSAVGTVLYIVFDALDDADASTKLGAAGSRFVIMLGERRKWTFSQSTPVYRIDVASDAAAETGDSLVILDGKVAS